jgi:hypothetical protein
VPVIDRHRGLHLVQLTAANLRHISERSLLRFLRLEFAHKGGRRLTACDQLELVGVLDCYFELAKLRRKDALG